MRLTYLYVTSLVSRYVGLLTFDFARKSGLEGGGFRLGGFIADHMVPVTGEY